MKKGIIFLGTILLVTLIVSSLFPMIEGLANPDECGPDSYCKTWQTPSVCQGSDISCNVANVAPDVKAPVSSPVLKGVVLPPSVKTPVIKKKAKVCVIPKKFGRGIEGRGKNKCSEGSVLAPGKICDIGCEDKYQYVSGRNIYQCSEDGVLSKNNLKCRKEVKPQAIDKRENITFVCEPKFTELIGLLKKHGITHRPDRRGYNPRKQRHDGHSDIDQDQARHGGHHGYRHNVPKARVGRHNFPGNTGADTTPYNSLMDLE